MNILKNFGLKNNKEKKEKRFLRLFFSGFAMGSADIVPGVSGGTIAFILGIYEELIYSIKSATGDAVKAFLKGDLKKTFEEIPFKFLLPLGLGILSAVFTLSQLLENLLLNYPVYIWSFFFGLVVVSAVIVGKRVMSWNMREYGAIVFGIIGAYLLVGAVPQETPATLLAFFLAGAVAICAMILPGVSGSFLLIIMGKYEQILGAVNGKDFFVLGTVAMGAVLGLAIFSRVLNYLFKNYHDVVVAVLTGFMIGSLRKIWPWKETILTRIDSHGVIIPLQQINVLPEALDLTAVSSVLLAVTAGLFMIYIEKLQITKDHAHDVGKGFEKEHKKALKKEK